MGMGLNDHKILTKEELAEVKMKRQIAFMRATRELISEAKQTAERLMDPMDEEYYNVMESIDTMQSERLMEAKEKLGASESDLESVEYFQPSEKAKTKWQQYLRISGKTEEEALRKDLTQGGSKTNEAKVSANVKNKGKKVYSFSKKK